MSTLYLVPTPIGNIDDMTLRALDVLWRVDTIYCEDTRETNKLLMHFAQYKKDHSPKLVSLNQINESRRVGQVVEKLQSGLDVALVSDRGTPLVSDPGFLIVRALNALAATNPHLHIEALPGANALLPALQLSGFAPSRFLFVGFLSKKGMQRKKELSELPEETIVLYESPQRLVETLTILEELGVEKIAVVRELTKINQEVFRGTCMEALTHFTHTLPLGELTLVFRR